MKKLYLLLLLFTGLFFGCRRKASRKSKTDSVVITEVKVIPDDKTVSATLDSSLISLKKAGSVSLETVMSQLWAFEDSDTAHWNEIFWDPVTNTRQYPELALFADHSVMANPRYGLQMGKWKLNKDTRELLLRYIDGSTRTYSVRQVALKQMELGWKERGESVIKLKAAAIVHRRPEEDPYYPLNNQWRLKPVRSETMLQLRKRVKECVHFYALFFSDNHLRQETDISFSGLPSCFLWYNGGIGMQPRNELDKKWIECFYSEDQAYTAYSIIADELGKHGLKWPEHPTSWVEQTGQVLGQLAGKF